MFRHDPIFGQEFFPAVVRLSSGTKEIRPTRDVIRQKGWPERSLHDSQAVGRSVPPGSRGRLQGSRGQTGRCLDIRRNLFESYRKRPVCPRLSRLDYHMILISSNPYFD